MKKSVLCFLFIFVSVGTLFSQSKDSPLLDSIANSIRSKENLTIEWETSFIHKKGRENTSHFAKIKGIKYYNTSKEYTFICDGLTVYRKNMAQREVSISGVDTTVDYNPIKVLTFFGSGYEVKRVKKNKKTGKIESVRIKNISGKMNLIKYAVLYFGSEGNLRGIIFKTGRKQNYVKIKKLDSSTILKDNEFEIPK